MNKNKTNSGVKKNKASTKFRRTMSLQETNVTLLKKGNVKTGKALSVDVRPVGVGDREEEKQMANMSR
jgi:hypothetical protein